MLTTLLLAKMVLTPHIVWQRPSFNRCLDKDCTGILLKIKNPRKKKVEISLICDGLKDTFSVAPRKWVILDLGWDRGPIKKCELESWLTIK